VECSLALAITTVALLTLGGRPAGAGFSDLVPEAKSNAPVALAGQAVKSSHQKGPRSASHRLRRPKVSHRAAVLNGQIDPVLDLNWYLNDPTLRRGDMVVLKNKVLVYDGPAEKGPHMRTEFADLRTSTVIESETKKLVFQMTGLMSSSEPAQTSAEVTVIDNPDKMRSEVDAPNASPAKGVVRPASGKKPYRITVSTFADAYARRTRSSLHRKRVAYDARLTYRQGYHPTRSYYSRPAYAPALMPFWDW
jgi:hypothetical protein